MTSSFFGPFYTPPPCYLLTITNCCILVDLAEVYCRYNGFYAPAGRNAFDDVLYVQDNPENV